MSEHCHSFKNYSVVRAVFPQPGVVASLVGFMHATTLPTMYSKLIPRQLSQQLRTLFSLHAMRTRSKNRAWNSSLWHPDLPISVRIPYSPPAFSFFRLFTAPTKSPSKCGLSGLCTTPSSSSALYWLCWFRTPVNYRLHQFSLSSAEVQGLPNLSLMVPLLTGTRPLHACCISRMHCHTPFLGLFLIGLPEKPGILHSLLLSMHLFKTHSSATSYTNCSLAGGGAQGSLYFLSTSPAIFPVQELLLPLQLSFL